MDNFEDSRNALFCDPNAYIQKFDKKCNCPNCNGESKDRRKIIFQEPYECMPSYHLNNDFKKGNCDYGCQCKEKDKHDCNNNNSFDLKNILPLISSLTGNSKIGDVLKILGGNGEGGLSNILSSFGNGGNLSSLLGGLDISKLFNKKQPAKKPEMKSSDFCIKDYTRVE